MATLKNATKTKNCRGGSGKIVILLILVVAAIGAGVYFSGNKSEEGTTEQASAASTEQNVEQQVASLESQAGNETPAATPEEPAPAAIAVEKPPKIAPGNPIVAKLNGKEIKRVDVLRFTQQLSPQARQQPIEKLYPFALEQLINNQVISEKVKGADFSEDSLFKEQMAQAEINITRTIFMQKEVEKRITEKRVKKEYAKYKKTFPDIDEVKAAHILVSDEAKAKALIEELNGGADFSELAKANSIDKSSAPTGGVMNYVTKTEVVQPFAKAAFALKAGEYTKEPVQSRFGYHIIKMQDKRKRPPVDFETAKPQIEIQLRPMILEEVVDEWKAASKIEKFDINGNEIEPAAGK